MALLVVNSVLSTSIVPVHVVSSRENLFSGQLARNDSFDLPPASDSSRSTSPTKRRTVNWKWTRNKFSREPSQDDDSGSLIAPEPFPTSHTRTLPLDEECEDSDCDFGYHSDTAIDIQISSQMILFKRTLAMRQAHVYHEDERIGEDDAVDDHSDTPRRGRKMQESSPPVDVEMHDYDTTITYGHEYHEHEHVSDEEVESEYEAPVDRKRKRKVSETVTVSVTAKSRREPVKKPRPKTISTSSAQSGAPEQAEYLESNQPRKQTQRRAPTKRSRVQEASLISETGDFTHPLNSHTQATSTPTVLEFPCPYISPEGRRCAKKFPRWTDYEKHYETMHTGDSGYPWVQKIEAKDCPFRCPHPIPSASRPKSNKGRVVKTVEYGPCDFVTRKNTHDFERHWKGNHIRSEALFIARGNMQIEEAKYVNGKEKFEIAYALCPRCPRCEENFTRTDALTRHLRSPCAGGSVGAAVEDTYAALDHAREVAKGHLSLQQPSTIQEQMYSHSIPNSDGSVPLHASHAYPPIFPPLLSAPPDMPNRPYPPQ